MERLTDAVCTLVSIAEEYITREQFEELDECGATIIDCLYKLKQYEDLEEQGLLLKLPCKVGDVVAIVLMIPSTGRKYIEQAEIKEINIGKHHTRKDIQLKVEPIAKRGTTYKYYFSEWGKNIFTTLAEAEKALEMEKKDGANM